MALRWTTSACLSPPAREIELTQLLIDRFVPTGQNVLIKGLVTNKGSDTLAHFDLEWSDGTNTYSDHFDQLAILTLGTYEFTTMTPFTPTEAQSYHISVSISSPNGTMDSDTINNEASAIVSGVSFIPMKR